MSCRACRREARRPRRAGGPEAKPDEHVVEPRLEQPQEVLAGDAGLAARLLVVVGELLLQDAVVAAGLLLLTQLEAVLGLLLPAAAVVAGRVGPALDAALVGQAALALEEELDALAAALLALGSAVARHAYTLLRLRGRQPLWACGVTSRIPVTSRPAAWSERIAVSRPEPGPLTYTSTRSRPCSIPLRAAESAVTWAANGVDLRDPLKPAPPADSQAITFPSLSVRATIVLLKLVLMWAWPNGMFLRGLRRPPRPRPPRCWATLLLHLLLARHLHPLRALARARVRLRALAVDRQAAPVAQAAVAADLHQALDVLGALAAQVALDGQLVVDVVAELADLVLGEVADVGVGVDAGGRERGARLRVTDAVDVGQPDLDALVQRDVDACDTCHA